MRKGAEDFLEQNQKRPHHQQSKGVACVLCNGCPENRVDVARAEHYLVENGWVLSNDWHNADLILFNACGQGNESTDHSINIIAEIQKKKKTGQKLIVWGCLPKIDPSAIRAVSDCLISPGTELAEVEQQIGRTSPIDDISANTLSERIPFTKENAGTFVRYQGSKISQLFRRLAVGWDAYINLKFNLLRENDSSIFFIKVSTGCMSNCSYCAIKKSRGQTTSKPISLVKVEFQKGLAAHYTQFTLLGTDLGPYGVDLGCSLTDLLRELINIKGNFKINLRNVNPYYIVNNYDDFIELVKSKKIRCIETAAESGSNRILQLMNRRYTIEQYVAVVKGIKRAFPKIILRTQLIAGFPTETEAEFESTLKLLNDVHFDYVEVYKYSDRPGTRSEKIQPKVPDQIKQQRFIKLYAKALLNRTPSKLLKIILREY